jgi:acetolactate synthase I/II/III large subunit
VKYKIPVICLVYNNNAWGVYSEANRTPQATHMYLFQENLRYDKMAEGLGARGEYVQTPGELRAALKRAYDEASRGNVSTLINMQAKKEFSVASLYPPGWTFSPEPGVGALMH